MALLVGDTNLRTNTCLEEVGGWRYGQEGDILRALTVSSLRLPGGMMNSFSPSPIHTWRFLLDMTPLKLLSRITTFFQVYAFRNCAVSIEI